MDRMLDATALAEDHHFWFIGLRRHAHQFLTAALAGRRPGRLLDCGAGTGRNLEWLGSFGWSVGLERSETGLRIGRSFGRRLVRGSVTDLPFPDASMDVATSFDVLYCLDDASEARAVREMWRVLRPGGIVLVNVAALDILHGSHSTLTMEVRRYTPARLRRLLEGAGFFIDRLTFTNLPTFPVTLAVRLWDRVSGRVAKASDADLRVPLPPINATFNAALAIEAWVARRLNLPIGTSLFCVARKSVDGL